MEVEITGLENQEELERCTEKSRYRISNNLRDRVCLLDFLIPISVKGDAATFLLPFN
jgi:hypothetical protein